MPATEQPTSNEWMNLGVQLSHPYGGALLVVDGYKVNLTVVMNKPLHYSIDVYVNGYIKGEWIVNDCEERRRFYRRGKRQAAPRN